MALEIPEPKSCCFCIPLRRGLLAWGYIKLVLTLLLVISVGMLIHSSVMHNGSVKPIFTWIASLLTVDFAFCILFLIAAHSKILSLLRVYYYSITFSCTIITIIIVILLFEFVSNIHIALILGTFLIVLNYATQGYIAILVKFEIQKLERSEQVQIINEAQSQAVSNVETGDTYVDENNIPRTGMVLLYRSI